MTGTELLVISLGSIAITTILICSVMLVIGFIVNKNRDKFPNDWDKKGDLDK